MAFDYSNCRNTVAFSDIITFTRATEETAFDRFGNLTTFASGEPAFAHDPATQRPLGLQVFEQRTNLFTNSEFQSGVGDGVGLVTLSSMDFGSGTVNAAAFGYDGSTTSRIYGGSVPASTQCVISVFVEMDDGLAPNFGSATSNNIANDFALVISSTPIDPTSYTVQHVSGNVYRVSAIATSGTSSLLNSGVIKFTSNSNRTFKISGRMIEVGSFPTPYIPTGATAATRNASEPFIENLDTKPYWNPIEGKIKLKVKLASIYAGARLLSITDGTVSNRLVDLIIGTSGGNLTFQSTSGGVTVGVATIASALTAGVEHEIVISYSQSQISVSVDGSAPVVVVLTGSLASNVNKLQIGSQFNNSLFASGYYSELIYTPNAGA